MIFIPCFIFLISISLFLNLKFSFAFLFFLIFILLFKKSVKKLILVKYCLIISIILVSIHFIKIGLISCSNYYLVIEKKENYSVLFDGINKYYFNTKYLNLYVDEFDLIKINSINFSDLNFVTLESSFNFNEYLKTKGIIKVVEGTPKIIFNFPINNFAIKNNLLNNIRNEEVRNYIDLLLFNIKNYDDFYYKLSNLQIISLFTLSSIFINYVFNFLYKIFKYIFKEEVAYLFSFIILIPYFFLNQSNFIITKFIVFFIIKSINKYILKNKYEHLDILSISGILFLTFNDYLIINNSFNISFFISFSIYFINSSYNGSSKIIKKIYSKLFLFLFFIPIILKFNYSINILSLLYNFVFFNFNKNIYLISFLFLIFKSNSILEFIILKYINLINLFPSDIFKINIPNFSDSILIFYYLILFLFIFYKEINFKKVYQIISIIYLLFMSFYSLPLENYLYFTISFINVGQGDSTLITYKNKNYLIDTGGLTYNDVAKNVLVPYFRKNRIYKIDYCFITHYDFDHYGALESLQESFKIKDLYDYDNFDLYNGELEIKNLNKYKDLYDDENDKSLVLYFNFKNISFLLMGDASKNIESMILKDNSLIHANYIKLGHHGSNTSSSKEFLIDLNPDEVIISCGLNNKYKHPSIETINTLKELNIKYRRTDLEGTIKYKFLNI